jgi:aerobic-type carbon monoxide dehydrogenase small subunit (CoxS/CutS family)
MNGNFEAQCAHWSYTLSDGQTMTRNGLCGDIESPPACGSRGFAMGEFVLNVNDATLKVDAPPEETLLSVLRNRLNLTGTKYGCGEGQCGACTVLVDGRTTRSCLIPAKSAEGSKIITIEGLELNGKLSAVQQAFLEEGALQCGYCTSGMIVGATALLKENPSPSEEQIVTAMNGNICRCGTYPRILAAVNRASRRMAKGGSR